jgi:hypothetical protein
LTYHFLSATIKGIPAPYQDGFLKIKLARKEGRNGQTATGTIAVK